MKTLTEECNCAHSNRRIVCKGEKRVVLAGRREMKQIILKALLYVFMENCFFFLIELCRKREKERGLERSFSVFSFKQIPIII